MSEKEEGAYRYPLGDIEMEQVGDMDCTNGGDRPRHLLSSVLDIVPQVLSPLKGVRRYTASHIYCSRCNTGDADNRCNCRGRCSSGAESRMGQLHQESGSHDWRLVVHDCSTM